MATDKLDTVRKLLAKAERAGTPEEADTYNEKAAQLMAEHGIDAALLDATGERPDPVARWRIEIADPYSAQKAELLGWIARALRCRGIRHVHGRGRVGSMTIFGHASDLERVELLYTSLLLQQAQGVARVRPYDAIDRWNGPSASEVAAYRRSWMHGFNLAVAARLRAAERDAEQAAPAASGDAAGTSTALVLVNRTAQVEAALEDAYPDLRKGRPLSYSGGGRAAGYQAGQRADLGQRRVEGTRPAIR